MIHISTTKTFEQGVDVPAFTCNFCKHKQMFSGYLGSNCHVCGNSTEYEYICDRIRIMREKTGLSRTEIAAKLGYTRATIKNYEWTKTSKVYIKKFKKFILEFYKS